jgi:4-carboxymuconolactone decarboxylase
VPQLREQKTNRSSCVGEKDWKDTIMRLPLIPPTELSSRQKPLYDDMKAGIAAKYSNFTTMRKDGAILGPWSAWLHDPDLGMTLWGATKGMTQFRHLPEMVRQIIILTVGAKFGAAYEIYAHGAVALANGMSAQRLATIAAGVRPPDLTNEEGMGYDMATALLGGGVLASPIWDNALALFGEQGAREIVYLVGHYCFISMTLNGFAISVPNEDDA